MGLYTSELLTSACVPLPVGHDKGLSELSDDRACLFTCP